MSSKPKTKARKKPATKTRGLPNSNVRPKVMAFAEEDMKRLAPFYRKLAKL